MFFGERTAEMNAGQFSQGIVRRSLVVIRLVPSLGRRLGAKQLRILHKPPFPKGWASRDVGRVTAEGTEDKYLREFAKKGTFYFFNGSIK